MSQRILITKYNYNISEKELKEIFSSVAQPFAEVPGCIWKIWLIDEDKKEAGAIYLFKNQQVLDTFKESQLVASVLSHPALSNFDFREVDILKDPSSITRAPLKEMSEA
jgi:hypothetical protein